MHIDIWPAELMDELKIVDKTEHNKEGKPQTVKGIRLYLHSSHRLHNMPNGDDRSAITIWLPKTDTRRMELANALRRMGDLVEGEIEIEDYLRIGRRAC